MFLEIGQIGKCLIAMRARSETDGCTVRPALPGCHVAMLLSGPMFGHFLFGWEAEITEQASIKCLVAGRRFAIETMVSERPIGGCFEIAVITSIDSAAVLRQHAGGDRVLRCQVLIERNPVSKVDRGPLRSAQVTMYLLQFAHHDRYRFVYNLNTVEVSLRFQVKSHCVAPQLPNPAQTAKVSPAATTRRVGAIAFQMFRTLPVSCKCGKRIN